jgi:LPS export ABC transporter permease LptG
VVTTAAFEASRPAQVRLCGMSFGMDTGLPVVWLEQVTLIDRYILREWLKILGLILGATIGLLLIQALYENFRDLIEGGASPLVILQYYAVAIPGDLSIVLPISLLLSLLFVLGKLHRNNEIIAIRAAGLNIFATTRVLWLASLVFCGISLLLNARVVPWSFETSRRLLQNVEYRVQARKTPGEVLGLVTGVAFDNRRNGRMWYINRYSRFQGKAYGVCVSELDEKRREHARLMAREAHYDPVRHAWVFQDGREMWFDPETGDVQRTTTFAEKVAPQLNEDPELMLLIDRNPRDLSFFELRRIVDYFSIEDNAKVARYAVRYYHLLSETLGPLIILAIAIPFSVSGVRVSPAVGVSKSIGLFFAYYILNTVSSILGENGYVDPFWAAWVPNLALIGTAAYFFGKLR